MSTRYLQPSEVTGRELTPYPQESYEAKKIQLHSDETLVLRLNNGLWCVCPIITSKEVFDSFYQQYATGAYLSIKFIAQKL